MAKLREARAQGGREYWEPEKDSQIHPPPSRVKFQSFRQIGQRGDQNEKQNFSHGFVFLTCSNIHLEVHQMQLEPSYPCLGLPWWFRG